MWPFDVFINVVEATVDAIEAGVEISVDMAEATVEIIETGIDAMTDSQQ